MADENMKPVRGRSSLYLQNESTYMTGMDTYADYSVQGDMLRRAEMAMMKPITSIPASLLRKARVSEEGVHINHKDVVPQSRDFEADMKRERERRVSGQKKRERALMRHVRAAEAKR
jgi:hypothetical protein